MNKTSISSVVCLDIIDFLKKSKSEQQTLKKQFQTLINHAVVDIPEKDRMIVDTEQGAIITCSGALESALEDALFIALTIRDEILNSIAGSETPLYLLIGINLGSVRVNKSTKANEAPKVIGEGLVEAQRIMSFAKPNQILVSRAYYDMASKLTLEIAQMFEKYDMHAYEHDIYAVRRLNEKAVVDNAAAALDHLEKPEEAPVKSTLNWSAYALPALLALIMFFVLIKWMKHDELEKLPEPFVLEESVSEGASTMATDAVPEATVETASQEEASTEAANSQKKATQDKPNTGQKKSAAKPKAKKKPVQKSNKEESITSIGDNEAIERDGTEQTVEPNGGNEKSTWGSIKDSVTTGADQECTQAEVALNQCK